MTAQSHGTQFTNVTSHNFMRQPGDVTSICGYLRADRGKSRVKPPLDEDVGPISQKLSLHLESVDQLALHFYYTVFGLSGFFIANPSIQRLVD